MRAEKCLIAPNGHNSSDEIISFRVGTNNCHYADYITPDPNFGGNVETIETVGFYLFIVAPKGELLGDLW